MSRAYSYASSIDVEAMLPGFVIGPTSRPSATQVANLISLASDELDSLLGVLDYAVPIATVATQSIAMVRSWVTIGGAYKAAMAMPQGQKSQHAEAYGKEWQAILDSIEGGKRFLPDAARLGTKLIRAGAPDAEAPTFNRSEGLSQR